MEGDFEGKESADNCETLLEKLRSPRRVCKMQLMKLFSLLLRLMSREVTDVEELLTALEGTQENKVDIRQALEVLIVIYRYGQRNCYGKGGFDLTCIESIFDE